MSMIDHIAALARLFATHCTDRSTLDEIVRLTQDRRLWTEGHGLFSRIRRKTLRTEKTGDRSLNIQYLFEEICAKALYNSSPTETPFDSDSEYWVIPLALALSRALGLEDDRVIEIVAP